ncbi:MAG TPA: hypothetical protein V6C52_00195 [Coleofasciculaceae cyanobacterium]|jgi:hypothetical protein
MKTTTIKFAPFGLLILALSIPMGWADPDPSKLAGIWRDEELTTYEIQVQGPQITLLKPYKSGTRNPFVGMFQPKGFNIQFRPTNTNQLNPDLPEPTRLELMSRGHTTEGRLEFPDTSSNPKQIRFIEEIDYIDFSEQTGRLKEIEKHSEQAIKILTKERGFTIGPISIDGTEWRRRIEPEIQRLRTELEQLRNEAIPQAERDIRTAEQELKAKATEIDSLQTQKSRLEGEIFEARASIQTLALQNNPALEQLTVKRQQIRDTLAALLDQKAAYMRRGNIAGANELERQIQMQSGDLENNASQIARQFPHTRQVEALEQSLTQKSSQLNELNSRLSETSGRYFSNLDRLTVVQRNLADRKMDAERKERQIAWISRQPVIDRVELSIKGRNHFTAEILSDQDLQQQFEAQLSEIDQLMQETRARIPETNAEIQRNQTLKATARTLHDQAAVAAQQAGEALHGTLLHSIAGRAIVEVGANSAELAIAFGTGGPAGLIGELSGKLVEAVDLNKVQGKPAFEMFDETALRERIMGESSENPLPAVLRNDPDGPPLISGDQARAAGVKTASTITDEVMTGLQRAYKQSALSAAEATAASQGRITSTVTSAVERAGIDSAAASRHVAQAEREFARAASAAAGGDPTHSALAALERKNVNNALTARNAAIANLRRLQGQQQAALQALERNRQIVSRASQQLERLGPMTLGNMAKSAGLGLATSVAVDQIKGRMSQMMDQQEQEAWEHFFKKEVDRRTARANLRAASMNLADAEDALQQLKDTMAALEYYRSQTENDHAEIVKTLQAGGFHVASNLEFFPENPIELRLTLSGYATGENVILEKSGDPAGNNIVQGQRVVPTTAPPSQSNRMDRQIHYYLFPAARLGTTQERDALPLRLQML